MLSIFNKTRKSEGLSSIDVVPGGFALTRISDYKSRPPQGSICQFYECPDIQLLAKKLTSVVLKNNLQNTDCNLVLHPSYYRLLLIDAPQVPKNEYRSAVRWQIKDMVDLPLDDISVDIFLPTQEIAEQRDKIYVVAACKSFLQGVVDQLYRTQLNPIAIDIHELAIRNLLTLLAKDDKPIVFLHLLDNRSLLLIVKGGQIYFSRRIMYGLEKLREERVFKKLVSEIRRCFDYYQQHLEQALPDNLFLAPLLQPYEFIRENLTQALKMNTQHVNINELVTYPKLLSDEVQAYCCAAIGGALRSQGNDDAKH